MKLLDLVNSPWAITTDYLSEIQHVYQSHISGEKIDMKGIEKKMFDGFGESSMNSGMEIVDNVAIIQVKDVISKEKNFFSFFFGGTSTIEVREQIEKAQNNPNINGIILDVDSPGGTVSGTFELSDYIYNTRDVKPIYAHTSGMVCSASYAIASATSGIYLDNPGSTNTIGSIGVILKKIDVAKRNEKEGVEVHEFVSGRKKNLGSPDVKLTELEASELQTTVNELAKVFINDVIKFRPNLTELHIKGLEGGTLIGKKSIDNGLADGVLSIHNLISKINNNNFQSIEGEDMEELDEREKQLDEREKQLDEREKQLDEREKQLDERENGEDMGENVAVKAERERISAINKLSVGGCENLIQDFIESGLSVGDSAIKILSYQKSKMENLRGSVVASSPKQVEVEEKEQGRPKKQENFASIDEKLESIWENDNDIRVEFSGNKERFLAFKRAEENGSVRILSRK